VTIQKLPFEFSAGNFVVFFRVIQNNFLIHLREAALGAKQEQLNTK